MTELFIVDKRVLILWPRSVLSPPQSLVTAQPFTLKKLPFPWASLDYCTWMLNYAGA